MKPSILIAAIILALFDWNAAAQTADTWVSQGVTDLSGKNLAAANSAFAAALAVSPTNENANAYYAVTRLLVLASQPAGSNFLTRLGFPAAGRNLYAWQATAPKDTNGVLLAPAGVNANEFTAQMRTNILPAVSGAISNLAIITETNFILNLTSNETDLAGATVDYGDLEMLQADLWGAEYLIYTLNAQNLNVQLTAFRSLAGSGTLSAEQMLADYPQLFTYATTNDLANARTAFTNAVNAYFTASAFIRSRPAGEVRLFNYDPAEAKSEGDFRLVLQDLKNSLLLGPQFLAVNPDLSVDMAALFEDPASWRSLLPKFDGSAIELGSLPDPTFGGVIDGLGLGAVEGFLGQYATMLPVGSPPVLSAGNMLNLAYTTLSGHYYALLVSTNLADWKFATNFTATDVTSALANSLQPGLNRHFYRLRDDTGFLAFGGMVLDANTGLPLANAEVYSAWDGSETFTDAKGRFYLVTTLPSSWYDAELQFSAPGHVPATGYYGNGGATTGLTVDLAVPPPNDNFSNRIVLTGSSVSTNGNNSAASLESGEPDDTDYYAGTGGKSVWYTWTAPVTGSYTFSVSTTTVYYPILAVYTGTQLTSLSGLSDTVGIADSDSTTFSVTAGQSYQIEVDDYNGNGGPFTLHIFVP